MPDDMRGDTGRHDQSLHGGSADPPGGTGVASASRRRWRRYGPFGAAVVVVVIAAGTVVALRGAGVGMAADDPRPLQLVARSGASTGQPAAGRGPASAGGRYDLSTSLPQGPGAAAVRSVRDPGIDAATVRALAEALGLRGEPRRVRGQWVVTDADSRLTVSSGTQQQGQQGQRDRQDRQDRQGLQAKRAVRPAGSWRYFTAPDCRGGKGLPSPLPAPMEEGAAPEASAGAVPPGEASGGGNEVRRLEPCIVQPPAESSGESPVSERRAREVAAPVLGAAGLDAQRARVATTPFGAEVTAAPRVAGMATRGAETRIRVRPGGIHSASGRLLRTAPGPEYPLISPREAYRSLSSGTSAAMACEAPAQPAGSARPADPARPECPDPAPIRVTGVDLGLTLAMDREQGELLVPAWIFTLERPSGRAAPVSRIAVHPDYLAGPGPGRSDPGEPTGSAARPSASSSGSGSGASSGSEPGRTGGNPSPWPDGERPMTGPWAEVSDDGRTLTLHFFGGPDEPEHCAVGYTGQVTETGDRVLVRTTGERANADGGTACTGIAVERTVTVELERPLGERTVIKMPEEREVPVRGR